MVKKIVALTVVLSFLLIMSPSAFAENKNAASKLGRGFANAATGWIEAPKQIYLVSKERDPFTGLVYGSAKGLCYAILRTVGGTYDASTFFLPPYDKTLLEPEFVFEGWN